MITWNRIEKNPICDGINCTKEATHEYMFLVFGFLFSDKKYCIDCLKQKTRL